MIVGVGVDLIDIARVERLLELRGNRALARLFTDAEVEYARSRARPAMHLAARLAAKEAAFKALAGTDEARLIGWREVEVVSPRGGGQPALRLVGRADARARELGVTTAFLSLTHTDVTAGAVVVLQA